jgi:hypothetical protein
MSVIKTFGPEPNTAIIDFFVDELGTEVEIEQLPQLSYALSITRPNEVIDELAEHQFVIHDNVRFWRAAHNAVFEGLDDGYVNVDMMGSNEGGLPKLAREITHRFNRYLRVGMAGSCFRVPPSHEDNISLKDRAAVILPTIGVPVPRTVEAVDFEHDFFPVYLKKKNSACNRDNHYIAVPDDFDVHTGLHLEQYIVQEEVISPTTLYGISSNLRFIVYGEHVVGGMIYYNSNHDFQVNGIVGCDGIPLTEEMRRPMTDLEAYITELYSLSSFEIEKVTKYASRVGEYGKEHGSPIAAVEFVMDQGTREFKCIDINARFGLGLFHVLYHNDQERTEPEKLTEMAGRIFARMCLEKNMYEL